MKAPENLLTQLRTTLAEQQEALRRGDLDRLSRALSEAVRLRGRITDLRGAGVDRAELQELLNLSRAMEQELAMHLDMLQAQIKDLGAARHGLKRLRSSLRTPRPEPRFLDHQA